MPITSCPVASKPTITGITTSNYSEGSTDDSDKFNILVSGNSFTPFTTQTIALSSTVGGKSSPITQQFAFDVGNPLCNGVYTSAEDSKIQADNPNLTFVIDDSFNQDFVFPANPNADFSACSHSLKFKGADISSFPAI